MKKSAEKINDSLMNRQLVRIYWHGKLQPVGCWSIREAVNRIEGIESQCYNPSDKWSLISMSVEYNYNHITKQLTILKNWR